ncbi:MAG: hypothetical protein ACJ8NS_08105 [Chthoniobacterales bacterium]
MTANPLQSDGGYILDDWQAYYSPFQENAMDQKYPWEDVEASRRNRRLQRRHRLAERLDDGLATYFGYARPCPKCGLTPDKLSWFYFRSPKETWENECGVAGWMAVCDPCHIQVNFFDEVIS